MRFRKGDIVSTTQGGRFYNEGPFVGVVLKTQMKWKNYPAVVVRKLNNIRGQEKVLCLVKNLVLEER